MINSDIPFAELLNLWNVVNAITPDLKGEEAWNRVMLENIHIHSSFEDFKTRIKKPSRTEHNEILKQGVFKLGELGIREPISFIYKRKVK